MVTVICLVDLTTFWVNRGAGNIIYHAEGHDTTALAEAQRT